MLTITPARLSPSRRERDSLAALKAARDEQQELHRKQQMLAGGLETLQRMARRGQGCPCSSAGVTPRGSTGGVRPGRHSQLGDGAMAVLSALLKSLQSPEAAGHQVSVVSPQHSEVVPGPAGSAANHVDALTLQLPEEGQAGEEGLSDPLDIASLLPEGGSGMLSGASGAAAPPLAGGPPGVEEAQQPAIKAALPAVEARSTSLSEQLEPGSFSIRAVRSRREAGGPGGAAATTISASSSHSLSRIPAPPAKAGTSPARDSRRSPLSNGKLSRLLAPCRHLSPHATLSSTAEAGRPSTQHQHWK